MHTCGHAALGTAGKDVSLGTDALGSAGEERVLGKTVLGRHGRMVSERMCPEIAGLNLSLGTCCIEKQVKHVSLGIGCLSR